MQDPVDEESSSDEDNFVAVSRPTKPPEKSPCSAPPGATSELEVTPELNNSLPSAEPPEAVENQQISDEETSNHILPHQNDFDNPALATAPTNVAQPTNEPLDLMQEPCTSYSQDRVTRTHHEPARLTHYAPGQSPHCQQNFVDASIYRPPPMVWQYHPMPPPVYPNYSITQVQPASQVFGLPYLLKSAHPLQANFPYQISP